MLFIVLRRRRRVARRGIKMTETRSASSAELSEGVRWTRSDHHEPEIYDIEITSTGGPLYEKQGVNGVGTGGAAPASAGERLRAKIREDEDMRI